MTWDNVLKAKDYPKSRVCKNCHKLIINCDCMFADRQWRV